MTAANPTLQNANLCLNQGAAADGTHHCHLEGAHVTCLFWHRRCIALIYATREIKSDMVATDDVKASIALLPSPDAHPIPDAYLIAIVGHQGVVMVA